MFFNTVNTVLADLAKLSKEIAEARQAAETRLAEADALGQAAEAAETKAEAIRTEGLRLQRELETALNAINGSAFASEEVKATAKSLVAMATNALEAELAEADATEVEAAMLRNTRESIKSEDAVQKLLNEKRATKKTAEAKQKASKQAEKARQDVQRRRTTLRVKAIAALNRFDLATFSSLVQEARRAGYGDLAQDLEGIRTSSGRK